MPGPIGNNNRVSTIRTGGSSATTETSRTSSTSDAPDIDIDSDAFEDGGGRSFAGAASSAASTVFNAPADLANEMRRRMMEAHLAGGGAKTGSFEWARGPRTGAGKSLVDAKKSRDLASKTIERGAATMDAAPTDAAPAEESKSPFKDWSANATVFAAGTGGHVSWKKAEGEKQLGGGVKANGEVHAGQLWGVATAEAGVDLKKLEGKAVASATGQAHLVGVEGAIKKEIGNGDVVGSELTAFGKAFVGAEAKAEVGVTVNPKEGTAKVGVGGEAFAGAKAVAFLRPSLKVAGEDISSFSGVTAEAYAGIGVKARVEGGIEKGRLKAKVELGAALGVGLGVGVNIDVNLVGVAKVGKKAAAAVADGAMTAGRAVADGAQQAASAVASGAKSVGNAVSGAFRSVGSWFD